MALQCMEPWRHWIPCLGPHCHCRPWLILTPLDGAYRLRRGHLSRIRGQTGIQSVGHKAGDLTEGLQPAPYIASLVPFRPRARAWEYRKREEGRGGNVPEGTVRGWGSMLSPTVGTSPRLCWTLVFLMGCS